MHSVENKVCDNRESGTDDEVFLVFRSTKSKPGGINICCTEILDTGIIGHSINDWGRDGVTSIRTTRIIIFLDPVQRISGCMTTWRSRL